MEKKLMEIREALIGNEYTFVELDNELMGYGIPSEFDNISDWDAIAESGVICYYADWNEYFYIYFTVTEHFDGVNTTVKIDNITLE